MRGIFIFAMALRLTKEEMEVYREIARPAWNSVVLTNDLFSWQKEYDALPQDDKSPLMVNGIWVLMQEHSTTIDIAKELCLDRIRSYSKEYRYLKTEYETTHQPSLDVRRLLSILEAFIAGNFVWSLECPRYNFSGTISRREQSQDDVKPPSVLTNGNTPTDGSGFMDGGNITRVSKPTSTYSDDNCEDDRIERQSRGSGEFDVFSSSAPSLAHSKESSMNLRKAITTNDHSVADQNVREKDILLAGNLP